MNSVTFLICVKQCIPETVPPSSASVRVRYMLTAWTHLVGMLLMQKKMASIYPEESPKLTKREFFGTTSQLIDSLRVFEEGLEGGAPQGRLRSDSEMELELAVMQRCYQEMFMSMEQLLAVYVYRLQFDYIEQGNWIRVKLEFA